jgi:DNA-binding NtrC family response regulator
MDGLELIREAWKISPEIATILVTGLSTLETEFDAKAEGVNGFFRKPIDCDRLIGFLDALAQEKRSGKVLQPPSGSVTGAAGDDGNPVTRSACVRS